MSETVWWVLWLGGITLGAALLALISPRAWRAGTPVRCTHCGYALAGLRAATCPECGRESEELVRGIVEGRTADPPRERRIRRALILLPLALTALNTAGAIAVFQPVGFFGVVIVLAFMAILGALLFAVLKEASPGLLLPDFIGFTVGSLAASQAVMWWAFIVTHRGPPDAQAGILVLISPFCALGAAPYGAALGWLIAAAYRRLQRDAGFTSEAP